MALYVFDPDPAASHVFQTVFYSQKQGCMHFMHQVYRELYHTLQFGLNGQLNIKLKGAYQGIPYPRRKLFSLNNDLKISKISTIDSSLSGNSNDSWAVAVFFLLMRL